MDKDQLVPDELILEMVYEYITSEEAMEKGMIV